MQEEKNDKDNFKRSNEMTLSNEKGEEKEKVIHHHQTVYIEDLKNLKFLFISMLETYLHTFFYIISRLSSLNLGCCITLNGTYI